MAVLRPKWETRFVGSIRRITSAIRARDSIEPPYQDCGYEDGGQEGACAHVVSFCDSSEVLDAAEHALNKIAAAIGAAIVDLGMLSGWGWAE